MKQEVTAALARLQEQREKVHRLRSLQQDLRDAVSRFRADERISSERELAKRLGVEPSKLNRFMRSMEAIVKGAALNAIASKVRREDVAREALAAAAGLPSKMKGLSVLDAELTDLTFDVLKARCVNAAMERRSFANAFAPYGMLMQDVLWLSRRAVLKLGKADVRAKVREVLRTLDRAAPEATARAAEFPTPPINIQFTPEVPSTTLRVQEALERFGGETSPLGPRYVIGAGSFREIDLSPETDFVSVVERYLEIARGLLNVCAQFKNYEFRKRIREELGVEVEELELAIRLFTSAHPNRLTELHDAQRNTWFVQSKPKPKRKGDR